MRHARVAIVALVLALTGGCASVSLDLPYYWQSARGQIELLRAARPIDEVIASDAGDPVLRERLRRVRQMRDFASSELGLPDNGSYRRYAEIGRPFVVWNVFATRELSLQLRQWCFPVAGCVGYRGYFDRAEAEAYAARLRADGWETFVAGVPAYSTLGWFDDPVLSTFIRYPEGELARLLFHELAHQRSYVKGDTAFNECFAGAVEEAGVERWLAQRADPEVVAAYRQFDGRRRQFQALVRRHRDALQAVYDADLDDDTKRAAKAAQLQQLQRDYLDLKAAWGGWAGYDRWVAQATGNAPLASIATYTDWLPAFRRLLERHQGDLARFFGEVDDLARLPPLERERRLSSLVDRTMITEKADRRP